MINYINFEIVLKLKILQSQLNALALNLTVQWNFEYESRIKAGLTLIDYVIVYCNCNYSVSQIKE